MGEGIAFMGGDYLPLEEAKMSIFDTGFLHSDVVYDVTSTWNDYFFKLDEHLERFARSCAGFRLKNPYSNAETAKILAGACEKTGIKSAFVHMHVTRGEYPEGSRDPKLCENQFSAYIVPYIWLWGEERSKKGVNLFISSIERISSRAVDTRCKNFHWADLIQSQYEAYEHDCDDAVLCAPDGNLAEGPGYNIFVVKDGTAATPDSNCLEGISRRSTIELCEMEKVPLEIRKVAPDELRNADEAFVTSTAGGIMPVTAVNSTPLGNGAPGLITSRLAESYWHRREEGWCGTKVADILAT
jgi:branched-chain amino acid aminotransferase